MTKPIIVRTTKAVGGFPKGAELGYDTEAKARKVLGDDFTVVSYQDGAPWDGDTKKSTAKKSTTEDASKSADT